MNKQTQIKDILNEYTAIIFHGEGYNSGATESDVIIVRNDFFNDDIEIKANKVEHGFDELDGKHSYTDAKLSIYLVDDSSMSTVVQCALEVNEGHFLYDNDVTKMLIDQIFTDKEIANKVFKDTVVFQKLVGVTKRYTFNGGIVQ